MSVLGGIQPGPLAQYIRDAGKAGAGAGGLLQRFQMLVYPDEPASWRDIDRYPNSEARNTAFWYSSAGSISKNKFSSFSDLSGGECVPETYGILLAELHWKPWPQECRLS